MGERNINYLKAFLYSKYNGILAGCTLGIGLISAHPFIFLVGIVAYGFGVMFLHDSKWFQDKVNKEYDIQDQISSSKQLEEFKTRRAKQLETLSSSRKEKYLSLVEVGRAIEQATSETVSDPENTMDSRLRKIDELIWTYLKLLSIEQSLEVFIESERQDELPKELKSVESRLIGITKEIETLKADANANTSVLSSKERLFNSYGEQKDVLNKRLNRVEQAKANIEVVKAEQERLQQQVKLIRADAIATRNTDALTSRIDASVEHLGETNKWLEEMNDFKDIVGDMPSNMSSRIGFGEESVKSNDAFLTMVNHVDNSRKRRVRE